MAGDAQAQVAILAAWWAHKILQVFDPGVVTGWEGTGTICGCHVLMSPLGREEPSLLRPLHPSSISWPIGAAFSRVPVKAGKKALLLPAGLYSQLPS